MNRNNKNVIYGILLILLAVSLILWKLNVFNLPLAFVGVSTWGLILSVVMVLVIFHCISDRCYPGIFFPLAVICIVFDDPLGITAITPWIVLIAAALFSVAFEIIFPKFPRPMGEHYKKSNYAANNFSETSREDQNGCVVHAVRFGSATRYIRTPNLINADLSSQFGEMSVFFDGAHVPGKSVTINCHVSFGEMILYIPRDWKVENKVNVTLGSCNDKSLNTQNAANDIYCLIDGSVAFGELKLISV